MRHNPAEHPTVSKHTWCSSICLLVWLGSNADVGFGSRPARQVFSLWISGSSMKKNPFTATTIAPWLSFQFICSLLLWAWARLRQDLWTDWLSAYKNAFLKVPSSVNCRQETHDAVETSGEDETLVSPMWSIEMPFGFRLVDIILYPSVIGLLVTINKKIPDLRHRYPERSNRNRNTFPVVWFCNVTMKASIFYSLTNVIKRDHKIQCSLC